MSRRHQTRTQYEANLAALARRAFERHEITRAEPGRWVVQHRDAAGQLQSWHLAEIVVLRWGSLLVHGDVETVVFERCSSHESDVVLRWIGERNRGEFRYLTEKAQRGTGAGVECLDDRVARADILAEIARLRSDGATRADLEPYRHALGDLDNGEAVEMARHDLWRSATTAVDPEWLSRLGRVTDARVFYAHAACVRLVELLTAVPAIAVGGQ